MAGGGYQMGFTLTPLTEGNLDTSGDFHGGPHPAQEDNIFKMAVENRDGGNKMVKDGRHEEAIAKYSELIMQLRALGEEQDVIWDDAGTEAVRQLRAAAYLNLSLCFLKSQQWTHASNTATRALQGDKEPPKPEENVLAPEKKAKALFRRAQAQSEGFGNYDKAKEDLKKALEYSPDDKGVQQELRRIQDLTKKSSKAADKKMSGFLNSSKKVQSGEGIFEESLRPDPTKVTEPKLTDIKKLSEGLWLAPKDETQKDAEEAEEVRVGEDGEEEIDFNELSREINELREERPEVFKELRQKIVGHLETSVDMADMEKEAAAAETPAVTA